MRIHAPGAPLLDPFYATLRRRHPDIDIIVLAPEGAADPDDTGSADPVPDELVVEVRAQVADLFERLWGIVGLELPPPEPRVRPGPRDGEVVVALKAAATAADVGTDVLDRLAASLEAGGWFVHLQPGGVRRLSAAFDDIDVTATHASGTGVVVLSVASRPLPVGVDRARALVRGDR